MRLLELKMPEKYLGLTSLFSESHDVYTIVSNNSDTRKWLMMNSFCIAICSECKHNELFYSSVYLNFLLKRSEKLSTINSLADYKAF